MTNERHYQNRPLQGGRRSQQPPHDPIARGGAHHPQGRPQDPRSGAGLQRPAPVPPRQTLRGEVRPLQTPKPGQQGRQGKIAVQELAGQRVPKKDALKRREILSRPSQPIHYEAGAQGEAFAKHLNEAEQAFRKKRKARFERRGRHNQQVVFMAWVGLLIFFGLLFQVWPKEAESKDEKRALAQRPPFSFSSYFDGSYGKGVEAYYSDQFPMRDQFIGLNRVVKSVLTGFPNRESGGMQLITAKKDTGGQGDILKMDNQTAPSDQGETKPGETAPGGDAKPSEGEKPKETKIMESEVALGNHGTLDYQTTNLVIDHGRAMEIFYYSKPYTEAYAARVNHLRDIVPKDKRVFSMVVPTAIAFYGIDELRTGGNSTYDAIKNIYEHEESSIIKVDAYSELAKHLDEYLYFRTDHHWNGRGAYYGYVAFCQAAGLTPTPLSEMKLTQPEGTFLGSLYGYTDKNPLLVSSADRAEIFLPKHKGKNVFFSDATMSDPIPNVFLDATVPQDNHYMLYSGGDAALTLITSDNKNGKSILIIKDSYANGFVPFLIDNYEKIYVVDPRQFKDNVIDFINKENINDVMMMNYSFAVSNTGWLNGFDKITNYNPQ